MSTSGMTRCNPSAAVGNQGLGTRQAMDRKSNANGSVSHELGLGTRLIPRSVQKGRFR